MNLLKHKIKYSLIISLIIYSLVNLFIILQGRYYENNLEKYDLNKSGFFEKNERTRDQIIALKKVSNDTARNLAPIITIPFIIIFGLMFWCILKVLERKRLT